MNGRCETDPFDQAVDVCGLCYGEFCQTCLVGVKGRRHPLCKDCAIISASLRSGAKPSVRGSRKTAKARRTALAEAPAQAGFEYFDQALAASAAASTAQGTDSPAAETAEAVVPKPKRRRRPKKNRQADVAPAADETPEVPENEDEVASDADAEHATTGSQPASQAGADGSGARPSAVNQLDLIRENKAASAAAAGAPDGQKVSDQDTKGPNAGDENDDGSDEHNSFRKPRPFIEPAHPAAAQPVAKGSSSGAKVEPETGSGSGTGSLPKRRKISSSESPTPSSPTPAPVSKNKSTATPKPVSAPASASERASGPGAPVSDGGLPRRRSESKAPSAANSEQNSERPTGAAAAETEQRTVPAAAAEPPLPKRHPKVDAATEATSNSAEVVTRSEPTDLPRRRSRGQVAADDEATGEGPGDAITPTLSSLAEPFKPPAWTQQHRLRHEEREQAAATKVAANRSSSGSGNGTPSASDSDETPTPEQAQAQAQAQKKTELAAAGASNPLPKRRGQGSSSR